MGLGSRVWILEVPPQTLVEVIFGYNTNQGG